MAIMKRDLQREHNLKFRNTILRLIQRFDPARLKERIVLSEEEKQVRSRARRKETYRKEENE
jgi:hypothetical protein